MNADKLSGLQTLQMFYTHEAEQIERCIKGGFSIEDYRNSITKELVRLANEIKLEEDKPNVTY